jgi:hypothetical protein
VPLQRADDAYDSSDRFSGVTAKVRVPLHMMDTVSKVVRTSRQLLNESGREPTPEELAEKLGMTLEKDAQGAQDRQGAVVARDVIARSSSQLYRLNDPARTSELQVILCFIFPFCSILSHASRRRLWRSRPTDSTRHGGFPENGDAADRVGGAPIPNSSYGWMSDVSPLDAFTSLNMGTFWEFQLYMV